MVGSSGSRVAPHPAIVVVVDGVIVVLVVPWPALGAAGGMAEGPPDPHAASMNPPSATAARRPSNLADRAWRRI